MVIAPVPWKETIGPHPKRLLLYDYIVGWASYSASCQGWKHILEEKFGVLTDGEKDMITATKVSFKKSVNGRSTNHFKQNCKDFIEDLKKKVTIARQVLDAIESRVIGNRTLWKFLDRLKREESRVRASSVAWWSSCESTNNANMPIERCVSTHCPLSLSFYHLWWAV